MYNKRRPYKERVEIFIGPYHRLFVLALQQVARRWGQAVLQVLVDQFVDDRGGIPDQPLAIFLVPGGTPHHVACQRTAAHGLVFGLETVVQQEVSEIQRAYVGAQVAKASLASLVRAVEAAVANYAQAEARFKAGMGTALELADAEYLRTDAEIQLAGGKFELSRARAVLGKLLAEES